MDNFDSIEKAKELIGVEEHDKIFHTCLFVALRTVEVSLKDSIIIITNELKNSENKINYRHIYGAGVEHEDLLEEGFLVEADQILLSDPMLLKRARNETRPPKSDLGNMIWLEASLRLSNNVNDFIESIEYVKKDIITSYRIKNARTMEV